MGSLIKLIGVILLLVLVVCLYPMLVQTLWAHSITPIFNLREISWTEAFCLSFLCGLLFKSSLSIKKNKE